ncbi:MAG TPA: ATP-dependent zinc metalloprotease FtsH [Candidatus Dormibacteraeota bacterium]|nr:ATP-dependent zinc metalloprotease FtsH [Candidatus Dormibacteraeota bacterium]
MNWRSLRSWMPLIVILVLNVLIVDVFLAPSSPKSITIPYNVFVTDVGNNDVASITTSSGTIEGTFRHPTGASATAKNKAKYFTTQVPSFAGGGLEALLQKHKVTINATSTLTPFWEELLLSFGPTLLIVLAFLYFMRRAAASAGGGLFSMGRSQARLYDPERPATTFADVAGIEEAEEELEEIVDFLRQPAKYQRLGGTVPKGVLLVGLPGTGKTLLARAVAGEAQVPFFSLSASEFIEMIVGVGASRVRDLFAKARAAAPAIIFVDELDAIGRARGVGASFGGHDEREQTLNQILTEMDGFDSREGVIVLAATNRADVLDSALLRPGRFDRRVLVQPPDRVGRAAILKIHTRGVPLADDVDLNNLASQTPGLVGAELRNLVNEAALLAARRDRKAVTQSDFTDALEKVLLGAARRIVLSEEDRRRTACHESGHALLGLLVPEADPVRRVSIVPRGRALGVTVQSPVDDRQNYPETYLRARIVGALGGRAAEKLVYDVVTTGAESDLQQVTTIARQMVVHWGMSPLVGPLNLGEEPDNQALVMTQRPYSEATAQVIDAEVKRIVEECFAKAQELLSQNRDKLEALTQALLRDESLDEGEILKVTGLPPKHGPLPPPVAPESSSDGAPPLVAEPVLPVR